MPRLRLEKHRPGGISPFSRHSGAAEGSYKLTVHPVDPRTGTRNNLTTALTCSFRALCTEKQNLASLLFLNPMLALDNRGRYTDSMEDCPGKSRLGRTRLVGYPPFCPNHTASSFGWESQTPPPSQNSHSKPFLVVFSPLYLHIHTLHLQNKSPSWSGRRENNNSPLFRPTCVRSRHHRPHLSFKEDALRAALAGLPQGESSHSARRAAPAADPRSFKNSKSCELIGK